MDLGLLKDFVYDGMPLGFKILVKHMFLRGVEQFYGLW